MEVLNGIVSGKFEKPDFSEPFRGRFRIFTLDLNQVDLESDKIATLSDKAHIFALPGLVNNYEFFSYLSAWLDSYGPVRYGKIGGPQCYSSLHAGDTSRGGNLSIWKNIIKFSQDPFPENRRIIAYEEQIVRPIAERWKQQNLPNHELVFE